MGAFPVKERAGLAWWPGCGYRAGGVAFVRPFPWWLPWLWLPRGRGPAGAPAAAQRRGRTSWRPGQRRPI